MKSTDTTKTGVTFSMFACVKLSLNDVTYTTTSIAKNNKMYIIYLLVTNLIFIFYLIVMYA